MTVKCLDQHKKKYIRYYFSKGNTNLCALARQFKVSPRTIKRVIDEPEDTDAI